MKFPRFIKFAFLGSLTLLSVNAALAAPDWLDRSHKIFFPKSGQETVALSQTFPAFWWNFIVFQLDQDRASDWTKAQKLCENLKDLSPQVLLRVECNQALKELQSFATDWAQDLPLRADRPTNSQILSKLHGAIAKASLPTGDRSFIHLLQADPTESWQDLVKLVEGRLKLNLVRKQGFFYDQTTRRIVIPIQAAFSPGETVKTREILLRIQDFGDRVTLIGPHGSTLRNEEQVARDLSTVSIAGYIILAFFGVILLLLRRGKLLLLFPPVFLAVCMGALVTILIFGSIHGLTLSLGAGIIGLALDYGLNAALNDRTSAKLTWRSNLVGILTTLIGLFILMMSEIPLLRQMMVFSSVGLISGFCIFRFCIPRFPDLFLAKSFGRPFRPNSAKTATVVLFLAAAFIGPLFLHPNLDMRQFDFQNESTKAMATWVFKRLDVRPPLLTVNHGSGALENAHREKRWADEHGISLENIANYLPSSEDQHAHLKTWEAVDCKSVNRLLNENEKKFFKGFLENSLCNPPQARTTENSSAVRSYDWHLNSDSRWLTLWMPTSEAQENLIRQAEPASRSLLEAVMEFPKILSRELRWMAPLSMFLVFLILFLYYPKKIWSLVALVPFFSGLGLFTLAVLVLKLEISFISVIALVMSFGFSFDYAVFAVDHYAFKKEDIGDGVWEAISSAACATLAGFVPLLFCKHPVLKHLGQALCISTVGCYLGAVWGVPGFMRKKKKAIS